MNPRVQLLIYGSVPAILGAVGIVFLRRAGKHFSGFNPSAIVAGFTNALLGFDIWVGLAVYAFAFAWLMVVIPRVEITRFYPIAVGLNIIFVTVGGILLQHEGLTVSKLVGILLVVCGVFFVSI